MRILLSVLMLLATAACAGTTSPAASSTPEQPATLTITLGEPDPGAPMYIEGAVRFVRLTADGVEITRRVELEGPTTIPVPAGGTYRLESWARPCDGNCGTLDAPTDRCAETLTVAGDSTVRIEIDPTPGRDCAITVTT
jgi:hypothetical protein